MNKTAINRLFIYLVIVGNALYFLWLLYNGINEKFSGSLVMIIAPLGLMILLIINILLLSKK